MKLKNLFENQVVTKEIVEDYCLSSQIIGGDRSVSSRFENFLKTSNDQFKAESFLATLTEKERNTILVEHNRIDRHIEIRGNEVSIFQMNIYGFDVIGPPPFKLGEIMIDFSVFESADSLKEIPNWFPRKTWRLDLNLTGIESLHNIHKVVHECEEITLTHNKNLKSSILGLMQIKGLQYVEFDDKKLTEIVNYNLKEGDVFECQEDLIKAGYKEFAKL